MPPPENLKHKLVTPDADVDGRAHSGNTLCPFHHSSKDGGHKKEKKNRNVSFVQIKKIHN